MSELKVGDKVKVSENYISIPLLKVFFKKNAVTHGETNGIQTFSD